METCSCEALLTPFGSFHFVKDDDDLMYLSVKELSNFVESKNGTSINHRLVDDDFKIQVQKCSRIGSYFLNEEGFYQALRKSKGITISQLKYFFSNSPFCFIETVIEPNGLI